MLPLYARRLGARVTIHDPRSLPFSRETGFDLRHRDLHSLSIQDQEINRLGPPFGHCSGDEEITTFQETDLSYQDKPYNQIVSFSLNSVTLTYIGMKTDLYTEVYRYEAEVPPPPSSASHPFPSFIH